MVTDSIHDLQMTSFQFHVVPFVNLSHFINALSSASIRKCFPLFPSSRSRASSVVLMSLVHLELHALQGDRRGSFFYLQASSLSAPLVSEAFSLPVNKYFVTNECFCLSFYFRRATKKIPLFLSSETFYIQTILSQWIVFKPELI